MTAATRRRNGARRTNRDATWCLAFSRHDFDGHVTQEVSRATSAVVWVAHLHCPACGTDRVDFMRPHTCELISRRYFRPDDYPTDMDRDTARKQVFRAMLTTTEETAS